LKKIVYILFSIILGILYGRYLNSYLLNISLFFCIICCYLLFFKINPNLKKYNRIYFYCILIIIFSFYTTYKFNKYENTLKENTSSLVYTCKILSCEYIGEKYNKYLAKVINIDNTKSNIKIYLYIKNTKQYEYRDIIKCKMNIEKPTINRNDGGFNNKIYCYSNNIFAVAYVDEIIEISSSKDVLTYIYELKQNICDNILNNFKSEAGILISIILGDDTYLTKQEKEMFSNSNLSHILVVSGTHLACILLFTKYIFLRFKLKSNSINILNIIIIIFYLIINKFSLSILRASIMHIISIIYNIKNKHKNNLQIILKLMILFLIINPLYLFNISLILSFISVISIQLFNNKTASKLQYNLNNKNDINLKNIFQIISVSICVQIAIIPILSIYFQKIYLTSILSSILATPISNLLIILGIIYCLTCFIPIISNILCFVLRFLIIILKYISIYFSNIPLSNISIYPFRWYEILIYYFALYSIFFNNNLYINMKIVIWSIFKKNRRNKILLGIILLLVIFSIYFSNNHLKIDFIDVGQGDSICIRVFGKNILIDGGNANDKYDNGKTNILPFLLFNRIDKLDYIIISHFDSDHINGLIYVINNYTVDNIIFAENIDDKSEEFVNFMNRIKKNNISIKTVKNNDRMNISNNVYLDFYTTDKNTLITENMSNNNSLVCRLVYYNTKFLFTGDAEKEQEVLLLKNNDIKADVIKIGHHGSKNSTTNDFLDKVSPSIAIIQVGSNYYGHPHKEVLNRLKQINCKIYRNDVNGQITLIVNRYGKTTIKTKLK